MFQKIARVIVLSLTATVLPGVVVACSGGDAGSSSTDKSPTSPSEVVAARSCTTVVKHDDSECKGGSYKLLDEVNDETCEALNDGAEDSKPGALSMKAPSSAKKGSPATFTWAKSTAELTPLQRILDVLEPSAHADGRVDGQAYMLVFADKGCSEVVRVFTKGTSWKADAASWSKLAAASDPITVTVYGGTLDNSALKDGTEVSASKPVTFTIK